MLLILFCSIICSIASTMLIWFKTDAFVEWATFFGFKKLVKLREYELAKLEDTNGTLNYPRFLKMKYKWFIFKLIGCPLCLCSWLSLFGGTFISLAELTSLIEFIFRILIYTPLVYIASLYIYTKINKLINESK